MFFPYTYSVHLTNCMQGSYFCPISYGKTFVPFYIRTKTSYFHYLLKINKKLFSLEFIQNWPAKRAKIKRRQRFPYIQYLISISVSFSEKIMRHGMLIWVDFWRIDWWLRLRLSATTGKLKMFKKIVAWSFIFILWWVWKYRDLLPFLNSKIAS